MAGMDAINPGLVAEAVANNNPALPAANNHGLAAQVS